MSWIKWELDILFLLMYISFSSSQHNQFYSPSPHEKKSLISNHYDKTIPPYTKNNPVLVETSISVLNIRSIKEADLTLTLDIFLHQKWMDYRLFLPSNLRKDQKILLDSSFRNKLWIPEIFFKNSIGGSVRGVLVPSVYFIINHTNEVFMAARLSVELTCDMTFHNYPHDIQRCHIDIMSLSNTNHSVLLKWNKFRMTSLLYLTQFGVLDIRTDDCSRTYDIGSFSCIRGIFVLERLVGHFVLKFYVPSILIVVMTFVGYWIPITAYPARVALMITSLLALVTLQLQIASQINTAYAVSINIWMLICVAFSFIGLLEYAFAIALTEHINKKSKFEEIKLNERKESRIFATFVSLLPSEPNRVDALARKCFPVAFLICGLGYFCFVSLVKYKQL